MPQIGEPQNPLTYNSKRIRCPGNRCGRNDRVVGSALRREEKEEKSLERLCSGNYARFHFNYVVDCVF